MTNFAAWLKPTLLGPLLTLWSLVTLAAVIARIAGVALAGLTLGLVDDWLLGMVNASLLGSMFGVLLVWIDVLLLRLKWRALPTGLRAWGTSCATPVLTGYVWGSGILPPPETMPALVGWLFVPMIGSAFALRSLFGRRP
ncbi:MAG: hypothetical protein ACFCGT_14655 [Sandaracinaceae bacterium]